MAEANRHYAVTDLYKRKLTLSMKGKVLAKSVNALILKEVGKSVYNPVFYFPKDDVNMDLLQLESGRNTHCPIKGEASYWNLKSGALEPYFA